MAGLLNAKIGQKDGPPDRVVSIQELRSPGLIVESPTQLTACRGTLVLASGQTEKGTVTSNAAASSGVSWESDDTAQKRRVAHEAAVAKALADVAADRARKEEPAPIEKNAVLLNDSKEWRAWTEDLVRLVRSNNFSCESVSSSGLMLLSRGYVLSCNQFRYTYDVQDKGGHWIVSVR
jgi:hypothetical protein